MKKLKNTAFYSIFWTFLIILILVVFAVFRYGYRSFFTDPHLISPYNMGEEIVMSSNGSFVLQFDQRMDKESVLNALTISPEVDMETFWEGGATLLINPKRKLKKGKRYDLSISRTATNIFSQKLDESYSLTYRIGDDPRIVAIFPKAEHLEVDDKIIVIFSHAMIRYMDDPIEQDFLELTPYLAGKWSWYNPKTLIFIPQNGFMLSTRYRLKNTKAIETINKGILTDGVDRNFETERIRLISSPNEEIALLAVTDPFKIFFNQEIDPSDLLRYTILRQENGKKVEGIEFIPIPDVPGGYQLEKKKGGWLYGENYELSISEDLISDQGNIPLSEDAQLNFRTKSFLRSSLIDTSSDSSLLLNDLHELEFSIPVDINFDVLKSSIVFSPNIDFQLVKTSDRHYKITGKEFSQKKEYSKLLLTEHINTWNTTLISSTQEFKIISLDEIIIDISDRKDIVCMYSNNQLLPSSYVSAQVNGVRKAFEMRSVTGDTTCLHRLDLPYQYLFDKTSLEPSKKVLISIEAEDISGQKFMRDFFVRSRKIDPSSYELRRSSAEFYQYFSDPTQLEFHYSSRNISSVAVELCQINASDALKIETTTEEKWYRFSPSARECMRYHSYDQDIRTTWGNVQDNSVNIASVFDKPKKGLYIIHLVANEVKDDEGNDIESYGAIQYSSLNLLSKRGESTLIWILNADDNQPISGANIKLYSSEGRFLKDGTTDADGIFFDPSNKVQYEFMLISTSDEELLFPTFNQEGYEPERYAVPFNAENLPYRYQFLIEKSWQEDGRVRGQLIIKERQGTDLIPLRLHSAVVSLSTEQEELLWKKSELIDEYGNLFFDIDPIYPLLDDRYQISVCLGLYEGVCHGTNIWTILGKDEASVKEKTPDGEQVIGNDIPEGNIIELLNAADYENEGLVRIGFIQHSITSPILITAERDSIFFHQYISLSTDIQDLEIPISDEMVPELIISATQFLNGKSRYDLKRITIDRSRRRISDEKRKNDIEKLSTTIIALRERAEIPRIERLMEAFYPYRGTRIITAGTGGFGRVLPNPMKLYPNTDYRKPELTLIDGTFLGDTEKNQQYHSGKTLEIIHDKKGFFTQVIPDVINSDGLISFHITKPNFIRQGDDLILEVMVSNNESKTRNLDLISQSHGLDIISAKKLFFGIPASKTVTLSIPTKFKAGQAKDDVSIEFLLEDEGGILQSHEISIPVREQKLPVLDRRIQTYESRSIQGEIVTDIPSRGLWKQNLIISMAPISFALSNLHTQLEKKPIRLDQALYKVALSSEYRDLLGLDEIGEETMSDLIQEKNDMERALRSIQVSQKTDGGWSTHPDDTKSEVLYTARMAKAFANIQLRDISISEDMIDRLAVYLKTRLDERVNERIREGVLLSELSLQDTEEELQILNALSSLSPSGINYANNWYTIKDKLSNASLVLLLLTLEDYRDFNIVGMNFRIEELIQLLKSRRQKRKDKIWLETGRENNSIMNNFLLSSWYLEALVRQASAKTDIPLVINWLMKEKYKLANQTSIDQFTFLLSIASYLRIFQEDVNASSMVFSLSSDNKQVFKIEPEKKFQSFSMTDYFLQEEENQSGELITYSFDTEQSVFIEILLEKEDSLLEFMSEGISIRQIIQSKDRVRKGDRLVGEISLISPESRDSVLIIQPLISGAVMKTPEKESGLVWTNPYSDDDEFWYFIDHVPAGEIRIPFQWELRQAGLLTAPPVYAYLSEQPEIRASSQNMKLEVR